jgi:hypothetical protein
MGGITQSEIDGRAFWERMSDAQLDAMIARCIEDGLDPAATD